jgi:YesN/AraC family two-component response regulator
MSFLPAAVILELDRTPVRQIKGVNHEQPLNRTSMTKIMLVEDNIRARRALKAIISQQAGIVITAEAANGQEAVRKIEAQIPDLIIMDMRMPVMDGLEATQIIKARWPQIKIVILSMYADGQSDVLAAGADSFLAKGCSMDTMITIIHSLTNAFNLTGESLFKKAPPQIT